MPDVRRQPAVAFAGVLGMGSLLLPAHAEENRWGVGSDLGLTAGTVNGAVFSIGFNLDYYPD